MSVLVDTDVLIWHLRGYSQATQRLDQLAALTLSAMSYLELIQGMRNKDELAAVRKMFELRRANVLPLTPAITQRATSHGSARPESWTRGCRRPHRRDCSRSSSDLAHGQYKAFRAGQWAQDRSLQTVARTELRADIERGTVDVCGRVRSPRKASRPSGRRAWD